MPNPLALIHPAVGQTQDDKALGTLSRVHPAPASPSDPLYVVIDGWSQNHYVVVTKWPNYGGSLPQPGAKVTLMRDGADQLNPHLPTPWVCVWWEGNTMPAVTAPFCNKLTNYQLA